MKRPELILISSRDSTHKWNLFKEVEGEKDFRDLARSLYPIPPTVRDPHWLQCAQSVARALFTALYRRGKEEGKEADNSVLVKFVQSHKIKGVFDLINDYEDLRGCAMHVNPDQPKHALSVWSTFQTTFTDIFYGDFAEAGDFSIREYVEHPEGKIVVLDMRSESEAPVFRLLVDWAIKHSLVDDDRRKYFLLDEFQMLPHLQNLGALLNTGRYYNCQSLLGLQSIAQFQSKYSRTVAEGYLAGMPQVIAHRCGDRATTSFIRSKVGKIQSKREFKLYEAASKYGGQKEIVTEYYPYSEQLHKYLGTGEAVAITPTSWTEPFDVWALPESSTYLNPVDESAETPADYVLPIERGEVEILSRRGNEFVREKVDSIHFHRDLSLLVVGETGSGKTTTLKLFAAQQMINPNEPRIVFDYKEDWKEFFLEGEGFVG